MLKAVVGLTFAATREEGGGGQRGTKLLWEAAPQRATEVMFAGHSLGGSLAAICAAGGESFVLYVLKKSYAQFVRYNFLLDQVCAMNI